MWMRRLLAVFWQVVILVALVPTATAGNYYVSTLGDDDANGSLLNPWLTLQHAADAVIPGDTVDILPGSYAGFDLDTSGTDTDPIAFRAQDGVTITSPNARTPDGINLEGASYILIEGFDVVGMPRAGIRAVGTSPTKFSRFVTIRGNRTDQNARWGIFTGFSEDLLIENNETSRSAIEHGIYVSNSADRPTIRDNLVWGNFRSGIQINADASLGGDGIITGALVERNTILDNGAGGGSALNMDGVHDSDFVNNLLYNNHSSGLSLYKIDGAEGSKNNRVINNTILQAADGRWALNIQTGSTGNMVRNNILLHPPAFQGAIDISANSLAGFTSDYNVVTDRFTTDGGSSALTLAQWKIATAQDAHSVVATAVSLFANPSGDFHLRAGGPAIDVATAALAPAVDLPGTMRPRGAGYDIGAYEHVPGDVNYDGAVDIFDVNFVSTHWNQAGPDGDANGDGAVNIFDVNLISSNWSSAALAVPEPGGEWLSVVAVLWLTARRHTSPMRKRGSHSIRLPRSRVGLVPRL